MLPDIGTIGMILDTLDDEILGHNPSMRNQPH